MPTYYRYGYQAYPYQSNWQGVPWHSSKPPHLMFGDITPSRSEKHLLLLAALAGAVYFVAIRKPKGGKTMLQKWTGKKKRRRRRRR